MRILFATCSSAHYMAPPQLVDEQINCGPYFRDQQIGGRVLSLETPFGEYDLAAVAARLPPEQAPDAVVCLVDASWFSAPLNLAAFRCPKILLVADTHHMRRPILGMIQYALSQPYDRLVFLYTRHHLEMFRSVGVKNLYWLPGLTFPHRDAVVRAARQAVRLPQIAFVGQTGSLHQRRLRLAGALAAHRLPLALKEVSQREGLGFYGASLIGFNATANGDLNLRVFEIIASGAMLLMDRLSPDSGLEGLLQEGREIVTYRSADELIERARHGVDHPDESRAIGEAGARWFDGHYSEKLRRAAFCELVFNGRVPPEFAVREPKRPLFRFDGNRNRVVQSLAVYEHIQLLHSREEFVDVRVDRTVPDEFRRLCATLPRVVVRLDEPSSGAAPHLLVIGRARAPETAAPAGASVWCWDARGPDLPALKSRFESPQRKQLADDFSFYRSVLPDLSASSDPKAAEARLYLANGDLAGAFERAKLAVSENPLAVEAYLVMAELALEANNRDLLGKMLAKARSLQPDHPLIPLIELAASGDPVKSRQAGRFLSVAWNTFNYNHREREHKALTYVRRALERDPALADAHYLLGLIHLNRGRRVAETDASGERDRGIRSLYRSVELAPKREDYWRDLAMALSEAGLFAEGAAAFRHSLEIDPLQATVWFGLGSVLLAQGDADGAARAFERALAEEPGDRGLFRSLGRAHEFQVEGKRTPAETRPSPVSLATG